MQLEPMKDEPMVDHMFSDGVYARTIHMLKGSIIVGRQHKTKHLNIITKGKANVDMGNGLELVEAPCMFESDAGVQKILYIFEDMDWTTIHPTDETDLDVLEDMMVESIEESMKCFKLNSRGDLCLGE